MTADDDAVTVARPVWARLCCCDGAPHICPGCFRVMSHREWDDQRACNDCAGGPL